MEMTPHGTPWTPPPVAELVRHRPAEKPADSIVRLTWPRWAALTSTMDTSAVDQPFVTLTHPVSVGDVTFLPATYAPR